jgi:hypothetical protein
MDDRDDPDLAARDAIDEAPVVDEDLAEFERTFVLRDPPTLAGMVGEHIRAGDEALRDGLGRRGRRLFGDVGEKVAQVAPCARGPDQPWSQRAISAFISSWGMPSPASISAFPASIASSTWRR